ncbi:MAG: 50S ribosomal protein L17 [Candidatus Doudnabacteria bacterium]|nr:50S ribosomal protein L17 [Candidatus Doudnabacteria bacterium]
MRHRKKRHLRGSPDRQKKELRALAAALILYERIQTTAARAKIARPVVEKMITAGKKSGVTTIRRLRRELPPNAVKKIMEVLGPRYAARSGGYTRILHAGRFKDGTKKVLLELVK